MKFAREVSNRVFYMDEGGIYEEGTPEQIFDNPQREKTRHFIKKFRILEFIIDRNDSDLVSRGEEIDRYCTQNKMTAKGKYQTCLAFEELVQQILLSGADWTQIRVTLEHSPQTERTELTVTYDGKRFDPREADNDLPRTLLLSTAEEIRYSYDPDSDRPNSVVIILKS